MIITDNYTLEYEPQRKAYRVHSRTAPYCPRCGFLMSGYDNRRRKAIDSTGAVYWLLVRRLRCTRCNSYHIELPSILAPFKQYEASVICCANENKAVALLKAQQCADGKNDPHTLPMLIRLLAL